MGKLLALTQNTKINRQGNITIPTLISTDGNSSNYVFSSTDDIYFEAEVYINSTDNTGPILEATSNTTGIVNEFGFGISDNTELGGRGVPAGSFFIYNGTRGGSLSAYYSSEQVPLNNWTKVAAQRVNGVWSIFINDIQYSVLRAVDAGIPNDQFGNSNLPVWIGRSQVGDFNIDGQIRNVILSNKLINKNQISIKKQNLGGGKLNLN